MLESEGAELLRRQNGCEPLTLLLDSKGSSGADRREARFKKRLLPE